MSEVDKKIDELIKAIKNDAERINVDDYHQTYHKECLKHVSVDGLWMEFGVYRGRSICTFADNNNGKMIFGFDSFEGLPEFWDPDNPQGVYSLAGQVPEGAIHGSNDHNPGMYSTEPTRTTRPWPNNVTLIKGLFQDTLEDFLKAVPEAPAAFVHIDSDIYSSCVFVLNTLKDRLVDGTIIAFDEIIDYPTFRQGEIKAFAEFLLENPEFDYDCLLYQGLSSYSQACFRIKKKS